jgi:hypothetical protein
MPDDVAIIIARKLLRGNAERRLPASVGWADAPEWRGNDAPVKIGLDDQHHALTAGRPPMKLVATLARSLHADMQTELPDIDAR